jgi:hypothetical protein
MSELRRSPELTRMDAALGRAADAASETEQAGASRALSSEPEALRRHRRRRRQRRARWRRLLQPRPWIVILAAMLALGAVWGGSRAAAAWQAAQHARVQASAIASLAQQDVASLTPAELARVEWELADLSRSLERIERATALPLGLDRLVARLPWLGPRYVATRDFLELGQELAGAGVTLARVGREALTAWETTGLSAGSSSQSVTWLDVLQRNEGAIAQAQDHLERARQIRVQIEDRALPASIRAQLAAVDRALERVSGLGSLVGELPAIERALGASGPVRYLVLFQNPAELRPAGGFPGTVALVTLEHGQLRNDEFFDVYRITDTYAAHRAQPVPEPYPIATYLPQGELLLHNATWWADFPRGAALTLQMYNQTGMPPADGIVAVQPAAVSDILAVLGPITIEVEGEQRVITAENVYDEIERPRRLRRQGVDVDVRHKEVLALIGTQLLERLRQADRSTLVEIARRLRDAAARRDLQLYSADPTVQAMLDRQAWSGRLVPDPETPTLAVSLANLVTNKGSLALQPGARTDPRTAGGVRATGSSPDPDAREHGEQRGRSVLRRLPAMVGRDRSPAGKRADGSEQASSAGPRGPERRQLRHRAVPPAAGPAHGRLPDAGGRCAARAPPAGRTAAYRPRRGGGLHGASRAYPQARRPPGPRWRLPSPRVI